MRTQGLENDRHSASGVHFHFCRCILREIHERATSLRLYVGTCCIATQYGEDDENSLAEAAMSNAWWRVWLWCLRMCECVCIGIYVINRYI